MNWFKRAYMQYMAQKGKFSPHIVIGLCEIYEYECSPDNQKMWDGEMAWNMEYATDGRTSAKEIRHVLGLFFVNHVFADDKVIAHILSNRRRVLPLFMACLKKRQMPLSKEESEVISHLAPEDFKRLRKPLHPWIEKELLSAGDEDKIRWYCKHFTLSSDAEMHLVLLASQKNFRDVAHRDFDYAEVLTHYVCENAKSFDNDFAFDFLQKQEGWQALKKVVKSRRKAQ